MKERKECQAGGQSVPTCEVLFWYENKTRQREQQNPAKI